MLQSNWLCCRETADVARRLIILQRTGDVTEQLVVLQGDC